MAEVYTREAIDGGDSGIWGPYEQAQNHIGLGINTRKLYLDGADLKISAGKVGLQYSSSGFGVISNAAAVTISVAALTASLWAKYELSQNAGTVVAEITSIVGANDPATLPTWTYDPVKGGHYITATKRAVALVWINAAGAVEGIVNEVGGVDGYTGYATSDDAVDRIFVHNKINYTFTQADIDVEYVTSKSAAYTILDYKQYKGGEYAKLVRIVATAGANGWWLTLPAVANNSGRIVKVNRIDAGAGCVTIVPNTGTISGQAYLFLFEQYDYVELYCDGSNWYLIHASLLRQTGGINTNDWSNRELGDAVIPFDGAGGAVLVVGEKVTEATSGNTGIIVVKGASSLTLKKVTGTGIFTDERTLTGSFAGGTVVVNIPGSTSKNADSNIYNGLVINDGKIIRKIKIYAGTTYAANGAHEIRGGYDSNTGSVAAYGIDIIQVDTSNGKVQTGAGFLPYLSDADGTVLAVDTEDYSYNIFDLINF